MSHGTPFAELLTERSRIYLRQSAVVLLYRSHDYGVIFRRLAPYYLLHLLKPLSRGEAEELIDLRLEARSPPELAVRNLKDPKWLDFVFVGMRGIAAREFMKLCRLRWDSARDLYNEALAGNADCYSGSEVLEFLVDELGNWRERLLRPR